MTKFLSRSEWTSGKPSSNGSWGDVKGIAVHYPGAGTFKGAGLSQEQVAEKLRGWRSYHMAPPPKGRGWGDIGYNFAVDQAGRVWELRGLSNVGAHCASVSNRLANTVWVGVLFVVGDKEAPTKEAVGAFNALRDKVLGKWPGAVRVVGHGQVPGAATACPGVPLRRLIEGGSLTSGAATPPKPQAKPSGGIDVAALPVLKKGSTGVYVKRLQALLLALGFSVGRAGIDGKWGPSTDSGFRSFQLRYPSTGTNGKPDGSCGPASWRVLIGV